jgi:Ca2+-binding RTX toxin-like protein
MNNLLAKMLEIRVQFTANYLLAETLVLSLPTANQRFKLISHSTRNYHPMAINLATSNIRIQGQAISTAPFSILAGEEFIVELTVTNLGDETGGGYGTDSVYLSNDNILDETDVEVFSYTNPTDLSPGESYTTSLNLSILNDTAGGLYPADRFLIVRANSSESVPERDLTDNVVAVPITVNAIDLSIGSATVFFPILTSPSSDGVEDLPAAASIIGDQSRLEIRPGDEVVISGNVVNFGNQAPSSDYQDRVYLSQDTELDASDVLLSTYFRGGSEGSINSIFDFINIPNTGISGDAYVLFQTDAADQLAESDESNNIFAAPVFVIADLPDLTVSSVTAPIEIDLGDSLSVSWTVSNIGAGSTPNNNFRGWIDRVYLSNDTVLDADDLEIGSQFNFGSVAPGASYSNQVSLNLPLNTVGRQYLLFATDQGGGGDGGAGIIESDGGAAILESDAAASPATSTLNNNGNLIESNETNNVSFQEITIKASDLTPVGVVASTPTVEFGTPFNITWTVSNIGDGNTPGTSVNSLFLSADNIAGNSDDIQIFSANQAGIVAGNSVAQTATVTINSGGLLVNPLQTDVDGFVLEVENNNTIATANDLQQNFVVTGANTYQVRAKGVVEAAGAGDFYRILASPGDTLTINQDASLSVNGVGAIRDSFLFLFDRNGTLLRSDDDSGSPFRSSFIRYTLPTNAYAGDYYVRAAGFGSRQGGYGLTIQQQTNTPLIGIGNGVAPGDYYIVASTDSNNAIREGNESNNLTISADRITVVIPPNSPDLTIVANTPSSIVQFGSTIPISWTVTNISDNPAPSGWLDYVYLSEDNVIDNSDILVSTFVRGVDQPALGAQESYVVNQNVTLPIGVSGNRFLLFATDRFNNRPETNEANNVSTVSIQIVAPDLIVSNIATVQETISGQPVNVSWTLTNQGTGAANGNWIDRVYLSSDSFVGGDRLLGSYSFTGNIDAGASVVRTQSITLPLDLNGTYRLVVITDNVAQLRESNETNNASVDDQDLIVRLAPVPNLRVSSITPPATAFSSQETIVQWTVTNTGTGATNAPTWFDNVYLSLDGNFDGSDVFLGRIANPSFLNVNESYTNSLTVTLPRGIEGNYRFIVQTDSNNQVIEVGNEGDNITVSTVPTVVTLTPPPDLQVTGVNAPINAFSGQAVNLSWTVGNQGPGRTLESSWFDRIILSTDNILSADDRFLQDVFHNGALNAGASYTGTTSVTLPIGISGDYYFFVQSDIFNQVYENIFEGNNSGFDSTPTNVTLTPPPDLEVTSLIAPTSARAGTSLSINYQVSNFGFTDTPNGFWRDTFYLSTDNQFDAATDTLLGSVDRFGALAVDQSYNRTASFSLNNSLTGNFFVFGVTDSGNVVFEIDENNNVRSSANRVQIDSQPADLVVTSTVIPTVGEAARTLQVQWTVANQGVGNSIITNWTDRVIASIDGVLGNGDDVVLGSFTRSGLLGANESYSRTENISLPFSLEGNYQIFVATDVNNNVFESNDGNNVSAASPLAINRLTPDLQVTSVVAPVTVVSGQPINLTWTVANLGLGRTNSNFWFDRVYLSRDTFLSADDVSLGTVYRAGALEPNATYSGSARFNVPIDLAGEYNVLVRTDSDNNVIEGAFETNNVLASTPATTIALSAVPDLVVQSVDAPTQVIAGQAFSLTWTVANNGASANQTWYDAVYLSQDQTFDRSTDIYLGFQTRNGGLDANGTYTTTQSFNTPRGLGGRYFAFVVTDGGDTVYERSGETNNVNFDGLSTEVIIPPPSDLVVTGVTAPASATLGQTVAISYTVQNQGTDAAIGGWNDTLYLSTDTIWDINDTVIGQATHTGDVASGASYTGSLNAVLPGVSNGNYHVIVRSDIRNQVPEVNEANNIGVSASTIALDVESLTLGTPDSDNLSQDESVYYRFEATAGQAVRLRLNSSADQSLNELYVRFGSVPTRGQFDLTTDQPFNSDPEIIVPIEQTGTYYVLAYGDQVAGSPAYEILAEEIPFSLTNVQTNRIGNVGESTLTIRGAQFAADTQFQLTSADGSVVQSSRVLLQNSTLAYVTFNLANEDLGLYDVRALGQSENSAVLENVVTVETARARDLDATITGPLELRADRNYQSTISYVNRGTSDVLAPVIIIEDLSNTILGTTPGNQVARSSLQLLGISADGTRSILRPGDINQLPVFFNSNTNLVNLQVKTYTSDNTTLIDWATFGETIRPAGVTDIQWGSVIGNIAGIVSTYGDYVRLVNDLAQQLAPAVNGVGGILGGIGNSIGNGVGSLLYDVSRLFDRLYQIDPNYQPFVLPGVVLPVSPIGVDDYFPDIDNDDDSNNGNDAYRPFIARSFDPNDILGPVGFGTDGWIDTDEPLKYTIRFENAITATAPAQQVVITQQLDADLDFRTFRVDDYGWAGAVYELAADRAIHQARIDLTATRGIFVDVRVTITATGLVTWEISSIDPATNEPPLDAQTGFLAINDALGAGEGFVSYTIRANTARQPSETGVIIEAEAQIIFDTEEPINTPVIFNTLDVSRPISQVEALAEVSATTEFLVRWSGTDTGSALANYTIFVSENNGAYTPWLTATDLTESTYTGVAGRTYRFYSVAIDNAGNSQIIPTEAQATIRVAGQNEAPTAITLVNPVGALVENINTAARLKVADISVSDDAIGTNTLSLSGADADSFEIDGTELFVKAGTVFNFEAQASYAVTVAVDDAAVGNTPDAVINYVLAVTDANEAPTSIALANSVNTFAENTSTATRLKVADINVSDDALGTNTLSLSGADADSFEIDGTELFVKAGIAFNFEAQASYAVTVAVDDAAVGNTPDAVINYVLAVTDANEAPTSIALANSVNTLVENTSTATRLKVADINVTDDALGTNTLSLSGADSDSFEIDGTELFVKAGTVFNFEAQASYAVTVAVDDAAVGNTPDAVINYVLAVTDANEAPTSIALANSVNTLAENTSTEARLKVADINVTDDALGTNTLSLIGADADSFEIDGTELFVKAGIAFNFEAQASYAVTVVVDDAEVGNTPDAVINYVVAVTDANEAPTSIALANSVNTFAENTSTATRLKVADINVTDDALGTNTLSLIGADADSFEIDGTELFVKAGTVFNFEAQASYAVTVAVDDAAVGNTPDAITNFVLAVTDVNETVNEAPTAVTLVNSVNTLVENTSTATRLKVADINVTDDALGTNTLSLSGSDANSFEIVGNELFVRAGTVLNFEAQTSYAVTVAVDDAAVGNTPDAITNFVIAITDANEAPTAITLVNPVNTLAENTSTTTRLKVADINVTDDAIGTNTLSLSGANANSFEIVGNELFVRAGTVLNFEAQASYAVTVAVNDAAVGNTPDAITNFSLTLTDVVEVITGTNGSNNIIGTTGNDTIDGLSGNDTIRGGAGNDSIDGGSGQDNLFGDDGNDTINGGTDSDNIFGGVGEDSLLGGTGNDNLSGGTGNDILLAGDGLDDLFGGDGNDQLFGESGDDFLDGGIGNDLLDAGIGNDELFAGDGNDTLIGSTGFDLLFGQAGDDSLDGGSEDDELFGGDGNDTLIGGLGRDTLAGGSGNDVYFVDNFGDRVFEVTNGGLDTVNSSVSITLANNVENLTLTGVANINGTGNNLGNIITGNVGNNQLLGLNGNDTLNGGDGNDTLNGGGGIDNLFGGAGNDVFILSRTSADNIVDAFTTGDRLQVSASAFGGGLRANVALQAAQLRVGANTTTANSAAQRFIYNTSNGDLFFDVDGSGNSSAVRIGNLNGTLSTNSFSVV